MRVSPILRITVCVCLISVSAWAGDRGGHPVKPVHAVTPHTATHGPKTTAHATLPERIASDPALAARLQPLLPSGVTLANAASGFSTRGQFIAALHVSRNLNIPFAALKAEMTGPNHRSLGHAIQVLRPGANVKSAVKSADHEAHDDLRIHATARIDRDDNHR